MHVTHIKLNICYMRGMSNSTGNYGVAISNGGSASVSGVHTSSDSVAHRNNGRRSITVSGGTGVAISSGGASVSGVSTSRPKTRGRIECHSGNVYANYSDIYGNNNVIQGNYNTSYGTGNTFIGQGNEQHV